jgi:LPXTG-motif cell wall-anchored protein
MLAKLSFAALLIASLSCFGQVVSTGGYATTGPVMVPFSAASAPLIATPDVALPGSGPAVGAPLGNSNPNDSRFATGPSVYNPNSIALGDNTAAATTTSAENQTSTNSTGNAPANNQEFEFGVQHVESSISTASGPVPSLGEIAKEFRAQHLQPTKILNNDSVARLNASGSGMGNLARRGTDTVAGYARPTNLPAQPSVNEATLMAQNQTPALPQGDREQAPEPAASPTAGQQRQASGVSSVNQNSAPAQQAAQTQTSNPSPNSDAGPKLPQTASHLPLILLIGGLGLAGGTLYLLRR